MKKIKIKRYQKTDIAIHKAVQILAFIGKKLGKEQHDDSHTTFVYDAKRRALMGRKFKLKGMKYTPILDFTTFTLQLKNKKKMLIFFLEGKTIVGVIKEVKKQLKTKKLADFELHYDLPETYHLAKYKIERPSGKALKEWGRVRELATQVFEKANTIIVPPSPINIWPHHFDTGGYHVLAKKKKEDVASVGTGFAMSDMVVDTPYFYIYGWKKDGDIDFTKAPKLSVGEWKTSDWKGAVVSFKVVNKMANPQLELTAFFKQTFCFFQKQLG